MQFSIKGKESRVMRVFKKITCLMLSMFIILQMASVSFAAEQESAEGIKFFEDFEDEAKSFTRDGACYSIQNSPDRDGKALVNEYTGKGRGTIEKLYNESLPKGRYHISFDYYFEDFSSNIQLRLHGKAGTYIFAYITQAGMFRIKRDADDWIYDGFLDRQLEIKKWYNIKFWIDTENKEAYIFINNEQIVRMTLDDMVDEFLGFSIWNLNDGSKVGRLFADNIEFYRVEDNDNDNMPPVYIDLKTADDIIANNFYKDNPLTFDIAYVNRLNKPVTAKLWYKTYVDYDKKNIWTTEHSPEEITVPSKGILDKHIKIGKEYFGRMNLEIIMEIDGNRYVRTVPYTMSNHTSDMPNNKRSGVANHISKGRSDPYKTIPLQARAGIGGLRDELVYWQNVEKQKGVYEFTEEMDNRLNLVEQYDLFYMHLWGNGNGWVYPDPGVSAGEEWLFPTTEEGLNGLTNFMKEYMKFADGRVDAVEVWNEYNNMSGPYKRQYKYQVAYHKALYKGVKEGDPNVVVSGFDTDSWGVNIHGEFEETLKLMNGEKPFDSISLHPYPPQGGTPPERGILRSLSETTSQILENNGYNPEVDYYFTELGIADTYMNDDKLKAAHTVRNQAIPFIYDTAKTVFTYNFHNYMERWDSNRQESVFGITEAYNDAGAEYPYLGKEAYVALAYYNNLMAEAEAVEVIDTGRVDKDFAYHFKHRDGSDILMLGAIDNELLTFAFDLGCDSVTVGDLFGNEKKIHSIDGKYDFIVDKGEISYIKGNFGKLEIAEPTVKMNVYELDIPIDYSFSITASAPENLNAEMRVTESTGVEIVSDKASFNNGKAELKFKSLDEKTDTASISIEIASGDKVYYSSRIPLTYSSSGIIDGDLRWRLSGGRYDLWDVQMNVKNVRTDIPITGTYVFDNGKRYIIPAINPNETRRITIPVPQIEQRSQLGKISGRLEFSTGDYTEVSESTETVAIPKTDKPPRIDGVFDDGEWNTSPALSIKADTQEYVKGGSAIWGGADDLSYDAYFAYDEDKLYVSAKVKDDVFRNIQTPENLWDGDSLQVLIGFDENSQGSEYGIALCEGKPVCYRTLWEGALAGLADVHHKGMFTDADVAVNRSGSYTYYEISFPWNKIHFDGRGIKPGQYIYFSIVANDDDNTTNVPLALNKNRDLWMEVVNCIASGSKYNYSAVKTLLIP